MVLDLQNQLEEVIRILLYNAQRALHSIHLIRMICQQRTITGSGLQRQ